MHHNPAEGEFHIAGNTFIHGPEPRRSSPRSTSTTRSRAARPTGCHQNTFVAPGQFEGMVDDIAGTPLAEAAFSAGTDPGQVIATGSDFAQLVELVRARHPAGAGGGDGRGARPGRRVPAGRDDPGDGPRRARRPGDWQPDPPADLLAGLTPAAPPADADRDGMADAWETGHGLDPADGTDHATPSRLRLHRHRGVRERTGRRMGRCSAGRHDPAADPPECTGTVDPTPAGRPAGVVRTGRTVARRPGRARRRGGAGRRAASSSGLSKAGRPGT